MVLKMLRFSVLSVFCVFTAIASVYSHPGDHHPGFDPDADEHHEHGSGWHYHFSARHWRTGEIRPGFANAHASNHDNAGTYLAIPDDEQPNEQDDGQGGRQGPPPWPKPGNPHTHKELPTHKHGNIGWHSHSVTHSHDDPSARHSHDISTQPEIDGGRVVHEVDGDHSRFGGGISDEDLINPPSGRQQDSQTQSSPRQRPEDRWPYYDDHWGELIRGPEDELRLQEEYGRTPRYPVNPQQNPRPAQDPQLQIQQQSQNPQPQIGGGPNPTSDTIVDGAPQAVGARGTPEGTPSPQTEAPVATQSAPQATPPGSSPIQRLRVTEYMVRDWSRSGRGNLPQWIELYNPSTEAVNLKGWTFQYAPRRFGNHPYKIHTLTLAATEDGFSIAAGGVAILSTQKLPARKFSGIEATQVYNLNIENVLKRGWMLADASGRVIQYLGREAFRALGDPVAPRHQDGARVSHHVYLSESPSEPYYYGDSEDIGSPGFYEQPAPAAPSAVRRKQVGTWANLKRAP